MTLPRPPTHHRPAARRFLALLLLSLVVSLGHVSVPWVLKSNGRQIAFDSKGATVASPVATRLISVSEPSPPPLLPPTPPTRTVDARRGSEPNQLERPPAPEGSPSSSAALTPTEETPQASSDGVAILYSITGRFAGQEVGGSARLQWKLDPTAYLVWLQVTGSHQFSTSFAWSARTTGLVSPESMQPDAYDEEFLIAGKGTQAHALKFAPPEGRETTARQALPLDPLSALLKLSSDLYALRQSGMSLTDGSLFPMTVRFGTRTLQFTFERGADETLSSPFGPMHAEQFVTKPANLADGEPEIRLWLAPEFRYAPVRVRVTHGATTALSFDLFSEPADFPAWR